MFNEKLLYLHKKTNIMKKALFTLMCVLGLASCAQAQKQNEVKNSKTLVTYFSATGTTKAVAEKMAKASGADLFEIEPAQKYTDADLDWRNKQSRSSVEMKDKSSRPALKQKCGNISQYDVVYIGFPIWWNTAPRIINTFIESHNLKGKTVIFFATSGGNDITGAEKNFRAAYPELNWAPGRLLNSPSDKEIKEFMK